MKKYWMVIFFVLGMAFRFGLIFSYPQPFEFDQIQYHDFAMGIIAKGLHAHSFRIYGYPLFIAAIYFITGVVSAISRLPWQFAQIIIDTFSAVLVYAVCRRISKSKPVSYFAYILYLFNPFTSAYTGVMLSEVFSGFILMTIFYLMLIFLEKQDSWLFIAISFILGFLPQVRPSYIWFSALLMFYMVYSLINLIRKKQRGLVILFFSLMLFCLPFTYNVLGNLKYFHQFALMDVDNYFLENFYISLFIEKSPQTRLSIYDYPAPVVWAYAYYSDFDRSNAQRYQMQQQVIHLSLSEIKKDPMKFIFWRIKKLWYSWEKHTIYPYRNIQNALIQNLTYWGNNLQILLAVVGLVSWVRRVKKNNETVCKIYAVFVLFLLIYTSLTNAFTTSEERYSLPVYPVLYIFCAMGVFYLITKLKHLKNTAVR